MVICPSCGDQFQSEVGMKSHHKQAHGDSIAGVEVECTYCSKTLRRSPADKQNNKRFFCDRDCQAAFRREEWDPPFKGETRSNYVTVSCANCDTEVGEVTEWYSKQHDNHFCDIECKSEYQSKHRTGDWWDHAGRVEVTCSWCGENISRQPSALERSENLFCDLSCYGEWMAENQTGEDAPRWKGGRPKDYGTAWRELREEILERDGFECVICGVSNAEHRDQYGSGLHVHHIRPFMEYNSGSVLVPKDELITLCQPHHRNWEGIPLRPTTDMD